uniref:Putative secreted peptide n=1 Tax=Anopheles braziliensis TaxID=58242 RepID=A0A2M3ZWX6_9DIPT
MGCFCTTGLGEWIAFVYCFLLSPCSGLKISKLTFRFGSHLFSHLPHRALHHRVAAYKARFVGFHWRFPP